jgi:hypothetical protein
MQELVHHGLPANEFALDRQELLVLLGFVRETIFHAAEVQECIVNRQLVRRPSGQQDQMEHHQNTELRKNQESQPRCISLLVRALRSN